MKKLKHNQYTNSLSKDAILSENVDLKKKEKEMLALAKLKVS